MIPNERDSNGSEDEAGLEPSGFHKPDDFADSREWMVREQLRRREIDDPRVLDAMARVPRHEFVPESWRYAAYSDRPLPIGYGQTISQPYIVALMTQTARPTKTSRVLEIGTGSGYQSAVLAELCRDVYSMEIVEPLARRAAERLEKLGYRNVHVRAGDAFHGWPEEAPFDIILGAAAPETIPQPLLEQLAPGGRLILPVGTNQQELLLVEKLADGSLVESAIAPVAFVPMTGEAEPHAEGNEATGESR